MPPRTPPSQFNTLGQLGAQYKQIADSHGSRIKDSDLHWKVSKYLHGIMHKVNRKATLSPKEIETLKTLSRNTRLGSDLTQRAEKLLARARPPATGATYATRDTPLPPPSSVSDARAKPTPVKPKPPNTSSVRSPSTRRTSPQCGPSQHPPRSANAASPLAPHSTSALQDPGESALASLVLVKAKVIQLDGFAKGGTLKPEHKPLLHAAQRELLQAFAAFQKTSPQQQMQLRDQVRGARDALRQIEKHFEVAPRKSLLRTNSAPPFERRTTAPEAALAISEGLSALEAARSTQSRAESKLPKATTQAELEAVRREFGEAVRNAKKAEEKFQSAANELVPMLNRVVTSLEGSGKASRYGERIRELHNVARAALTVASTARVELETASSGVTERLKTMELGVRANELLGTKDPADELVAFHMDKRKVELESVADPIDDLERRWDALRGSSARTTEGDIAKRLLKLQHGGDS